MFSLSLIAERALRALENPSLQALQLAVERLGFIGVTRPLAGLSLQQGCQFSLQERPLLGSLATNSKHVLLFFTCAYSLYAWFPQEPQQEELFRPI